jgi:hypothetical protein
MTIKRVVDLAEETVIKATAHSGALLFYDGSLCRGKTQALPCAVRTKQCAADGLISQSLEGGATADSDLLGVFLEGNLRCSSEMAEAAISLSSMAMSCESEEDSDDDIDLCTRGMSSSTTRMCSVDSVPGQSPEDWGMYTVVFDLDETLVYARDGTIRPRPHVDHLFAVLKGRCETLVWTAGVQSYAQRVLSDIDKMSVTRHCICRNDAWYQQPSNAGRNYVKDLTLLGRNVKRTIIIENTPDCVARNPLNSVIVPDYCRENLMDMTLSVVAKILDGLLKSNMDVPLYLASNVHLKLESLRNAAGDTLNVYMMA